jgi:pimeloyl-ACP methyl ester carboxylesterase
MSGIESIIFAHGAWANSSAWVKVLPLLDGAGVELVAASLPLSSLADDVAALKRAIALAKGPVLLVGHSYGGAVITEAGTDSKVAGLVYVTGFGPDVGESAASLAASGPETRLATELRPDAGGFLKLTRAGVDQAFAQDLPEDERALIFATQGPLAGAAFGAPITEPAWKSKPSWYAHATEDHAIHPELQAMMAKRMGAQTVDIAASHVAMLSQPRAVADLVLQAIG